MSYPFFTKKNQLAKQSNDPFLAMQKAFHDYFDSFLTKPSAEGQTNKLANFPFTPNIEVKQKKDTMTVSAELPGLQQEDLHLSLESDHLTIEGEKKIEEESDEKGHHYSERNYGYFRRDIPLPYLVDQEKAKANFKNGVLKVELTKLSDTEAKTRQIPIT